jgi:hypothetical protein
VILHHSGPPNGRSASQPLNARSQLSTSAPRIHTSNQNPSVVVAIAHLSSHTSVKEGRPSPTEEE